MIVDFAKLSSIKIGSKIDVKIVDEVNYNDEIIIGRATNSLVCGGNIGILNDKYDFIQIEKGILKNFLYDKRTALKYGKQSNGHGRRQDFRKIPIPRMGNTYIEKGFHKPEEILKSIDKGLLVKKMGGGEVNPLTGDFVFEVREGYFIEKGEVAYPVKGATLVGNGPKVLEIIDMVGDDLCFEAGICGKDGQSVPVSDGQPTIRIPEITVGGVL